MRIYENPYELVSEMYRDLHEMGIIRRPKSMQNKVVEGNEDFETKEIEHYVYRLLTLDNPEILFMFDETSRKWVEEEFAERINPDHINPGTAWKIRRGTWEQFLNENGLFDYTYNNRIDPQINLVLIAKELVRNPDSRQAWLPIYHPTDLRYMGGQRRIPCSLGYFFRVSGEGKLDLTYIQRSADAVVHFGNDVTLAWYMMEYMASMVGIPPGHLTHHIFSLHVYRKDWETLAEGISKKAEYDAK